MSTLPCRAARDPRDDGGHGRSGAVCAERRPGGAWASSRASENPAAISPARPSFRSTLAGKRVELLKDIFPTLAHACRAVEYQSSRRTIRVAARRRKPPGSSASCRCMFPSPAPTNWTTRLDWRETRARMGYSCSRTSLTMVHRGKIAQFAIKHRLPSMFGWSEYCDAGGLISYGANQRATYFALASLRRPDPARRKPRHASRCAAHQIRTGGQSQDGRTARHRPRQILHPVSRQQGDRMRPAHPNRDVELPVAGPPLG